MDLKALEKRIYELNAGRRYYILNDPNGVAMYMLQYNKKKNIWEYYFLDERGGISDYRTFISEEEACDFVYNDAKHIVSVFTRAFNEAKDRAEK